MAAILPAACLWYILSIQRGVLQGLGHYRAVGASLIGEGAARLVLGGVLIGVGLGADRRLPGHARLRSP